MALSRELQDRLSAIKPPTFDTTIDTQTKVVANVTFRKGLAIALVISAVIFTMFVLTHLFNWGFVVEFRDVATVFSACIIVITALYAAKTFQVNIEANERKLKFDYDKLLFEQTQKENEELRKKEENAASKLEQVALKAAEQEKFQKERGQLYAFELFNKYVSSEMASHMHCARLFQKKDLLYKELHSIPPNNKEALEEWAGKFDLHPDRKSIILVLNYFEQVCLAIEMKLADEATAHSFLQTVILRQYEAYRSYIDYRQDVESATFMERFEAVAIRWSNGKLKKGDILAVVFQKFY